MAHTAGTRGLPDPSADVAATRVLTVGSTEVEEPVASRRLTADQKQVLGCLQSVDNGLTLKQLEASVAGSAADVRAAVDALIELRLVCRLNTVIPSYSSRYPGVRLYDD